MITRNLTANSAKGGVARLGSRIPSASRAKSSSPETAEPQPEQDAANAEKAVEDNAIKSQATQNTTKTVAQSDEELRMRMAGLSGDGGEAGIEYEDGQPVAMKRGVKNNMFRYI